VEDTSSLAEASLEQIVDAVIFADATGTIRRWNRALPCSAPAPRRRSVSSAT